MAVPAPHSARPSAPSTVSKPVMLKSSQTTSSIKRRPTLKRTIDDISIMDVPSNLPKRSRVTFDTDVEIMLADEDSDIDPLIVKEQVRRAIKRHIAHDDEAYERVRAIFTTPPDSEAAPSSNVARVHLQAMISNISHLTRECSSLVHAILNSEWIGRDETYFTLFVKFLGNLAAAQGGFLIKIMQVLVDLLGPQKTRRMPDTRPVRQLKIHRRSLRTIQYITRLVPTASGALADRIAAKLDFDFAKADERMTFIKNFMELVKYVPELTSAVLTNILRQLIKLDTAVQADLDEEEEDAEDEILQHMSISQTMAIANGQDMLRSGIASDEDEDMSTTDISDDEDDEELDELALRREKIKEDVRQVDMIMDILFQHYSKLTTSTTLETRHNAIEQLISQFHNFILPTYRSRHPQFLIFHFAQADPILVDRFVTSCIATLTDKRQSQFLRHAAAAHFSGFIGRGKHVSPQVVQSCIGLLSDQLNMLRRVYEPTCRGPDLKRYADFYSTFQAVMYIFCLRWRDIGSSQSDFEGDSDIDEDDGKGICDYDFPEKVREALHSAIYSSLNPLRVCTPAIVEQFAKITTAVQFMYIYPKIEENKRMRVVQSRNFCTIETSTDQVTRDASWVGDNGVLEGNFPYDPYHLPISKAWIENDYLEWQGIPGEIEGSDSDEDDYDELEVDTEEDDAMDSDNY